MAARIVNLADPDEGEKVCATVEDAEQALAAMVERFKSQGCRIDEQRLPDEDYPQYKVVDVDDEWVGTYTIVLE
jgi:hypothetical protein